MLEDLATTRGDWLSARLRHFVPLGSDASGEIGEDPAWVPAHLMLFVALVAARLRSAAPVRHDDFDTPGGTVVREHIHVDLAPGHIAAQDCVVANRGWRAFNRSTGIRIGLWVFEMIRIFQAVLGPQVPPTDAPRRWGYVAACPSDPRRAPHEIHRRTLLGVYEWCRGGWAVQRRRSNDAGAQRRAKKAVWRERRR